MYMYRQLMEDDLEQVALLEARAFPTPWSADQYRAVMRHGGCTLFGALRENVLAGYIAVSVQHAIGEMEVYNIAVAEECRRRGMGKRLLSLALEAAGRNGITHAILEVRVSNEPAIALYRALGFERAGVRSKYYHDTGEDALIMTRSLPQVDCLGG